MGIFHELRLFLSDLNYSMNSRVSLVPAEISQCQLKPGSSRAEMRIHVLFAGATSSILEPCGDGKITIMELITKAKIRLRKIPTDKAFAFDNV